MFKIAKYRLLTFIFLLFNFTTQAISEIVKNIEILGNDRISDQTILIFSEVEVGKNLNPDDLNEILKSLYQTNFFENIEILFKNNNLVIKVEEFPIINQIYFDGIKSNKIKEIIMSDLKLKSRSSMNKIFLKKDQNKIIKDLKDLGYYFSKVDVLIEDLSDNKLNIRYEIELGKKAKIKKINFIDKIFKDRKLRGVIVSEEYKF